jgi:hypothetical protein
MGELLGALGLAWPRLLLYPGGLFALAASWLLARWLGLGRARPVTLPDLLDALPPLAALALLPLAPARGFPYGLDLAVALGLLEWPRLRRAAWGALDRAVLVRGYGPLIVAALLMAEGSGGLGLSGLLSWPGAWLDRGLLLGGAALWLLALPRLIAGGPEGLAGRLRALGLILLGALPLLGALAALTAEALPGDLAGWVLPPAALALAAAIVWAGLAAVRRSAN